jgi:hypothetical protein
VVAEFDEAYILLYEKKLSGLPMLPVLEAPQLTISFW